MSFKTLFYSTKFFIKKNSPTILLITGIATSAGAFVAGCVATKKLSDNDIIKEANRRLDEITNRAKNNEISPEQSRKERIGVFTKTGWKMVKLYSVPIALWGISSACFVGGNKIMSARNAALSAGFSALQSSYAAYREKVAEKIGSEEEDKVYKDSVTKKHEDAKSTKTKYNGSFDFWFDESCEQWDDDGRLNINYLNLEENYFNRHLEAKKYITMYDIMFGNKGFGLNPGEFSDELISASRFYGWLRDPNDPNKDNFVSIGIYGKDGEPTIGAINMQKYGEKNFFVRFNNPYYIYDKIPKLMKEQRQ